MNYARDIWIGRDMAPGCLRECFFWHWIAHGVYEIRTVFSDELGSKTIVRSFDPEYLAESDVLFIVAAVISANELWPVTIPESFRVYFREYPERHPYYAEYLDDIGEMA